MQQRFHWAGRDAKGIEKKLKKISHPRGIGYAFHRAGRHTHTHTHTHTQTHTDG